MLKVDDKWADYLVYTFRDFKRQMKTGMLLVKRKSGCARAAGK